MGRGLWVHLQPFAFPILQDIVRAVAERTNGGDGVVFFIDFGKGNQNFLLKQVEATEYVRTIFRDAPSAFAAQSGSSFPDAFVDLGNQDIYERQLFDGVALHVDNPKFIYSDRGSARAERQAGGGGTPSPRIDYAQAQRWTFFRDSSEVNPDADFDQRKAARTQAYIEQAAFAVSGDIWDPDLHIWGTQMIERTALGDVMAINSPASSTAARINIHLHRQLFYDDPGAMYHTDEDWTD
jgi:hypothetical protein